MRFRMGSCSISSSQIIVTVNNFGMDIKVSCNSRSKVLQNSVYLNEVFQLKMAFNKLVLLKFSYKKKVMNSKATLVFYLG